MSNRLIAIGDIHGCLTAFDCLLAAIAPASSDQIVLLGDYIDRGPDSHGVLERILQLKTECLVHSILGNHEEMLLSVLDGHIPPQAWVRHGGTPTLDSYGFCGDWQVVPTSHFEFLRSCSGLVEIGEFFFTHANFDAQRPLSDQDPMLLRWTSLNESPPRPHMSGKTAIVGHSADREGRIVDLGHVKCIDTFCYGGLWLTALDVLNGTVWQAHRRGELRPENSR